MSDFISRDNFVGTVSAWHDAGDVAGEDFDLDYVERVRPEILLPVTKVQPVYMHETGMIQGRKVALIRQDGVLVGEGAGEDSYGIMQVREGIEFAQDWAATRDRKLQSVGLLVSQGYEGGRWFASVADGASLVEGVRIQHTASVVGSFDQSWAFQMIDSPIVVVCQNTADWALRAATNRVAFKHTRNVRDRVQAYIEADEMLKAHREAYAAGVKQLVSIQVRDFDVILDGVLPKMDGKGRGVTLRTDARSTVRDLYENSITVGEYKGTGFGVVQAFNTYEQHLAPIRGKRDGQSSASLRTERTIENVVAGRQPLTDKAVELVLATV
jgi:hypothetical protein